MPAALTQYSSGGAAPVVPSQPAQQAQLASNTIEVHNPSSASQHQRKLAWTGYLEWLDTVSHKPFCLRVDTIIMLEWRYKF